MIKTIIITDPMGDETSQEIVEQLAKSTKIKPEQFQILCHTQGVTEEVEGKSSHADLLVIDYGGMMPGSSDMVSSQIRWVCNWAREHPGKLAILFTMYTADIYIDEFEEQFGDCDNIIARYCDPYSGEIKKVSAWLKALG